MNETQLRRAVGRREFFRSAVRYSAMAALASVLARVAAFRTANARPCVNRAVCLSCGQFSGCDLPPALSARSRRLAA